MVYPLLINQVNKFFLTHQEDKAVSKLVFDGNILEESSSLTGALVLLGVPQKEKLETWNILGRQTSWKYLSIFSCATHGF